MKINKNGFSFFVVVVLALALSMSAASALPVIFQGVVSVDGVNATGSVVGIDTNLESRLTTTQTNGSYQLLVAGDENSSTDLLVYGVVVDSILQPVQLSTLSWNFSFNDSHRLASPASCSYDQACLSGNCASGHCCAAGLVWCGSSCQASCSSGGGGSSGGGSSGGSGVVIVNNTTDPEPVVINITLPAKNVSNVSENSTPVVDVLANLTENITGNETVEKDSILDSIGKSTKPFFAAITGAVIGSVDGDVCVWCWWVYVLALLVLITLAVMMYFSLYGFSKRYKARVFHKRAIRHRRKGNTVLAEKYEAKHRKNRKAKK